MSEVLEQLVILCNQLVAIGYDSPEVLIASMIIVAAIAITIVVCVAGLVMSVPYCVLLGIIKLCKWLYYQKHPLPEYHSDSDVDFDIDPKHARRAKAHIVVQEQEELPPVYPDWMNQKSGRLL